MWKKLKRWLTGAGVIGFGLVAWRVAQVNDWYPEATPIPEPVWAPETAGRLARCFSADSARLRAIKWYHSPKTFLVAQPDYKTMQIVGQYFPKPNAIVLAKDAEVPLIVDHEMRHSVQFQLDPKSKGDHPDSIFKRVCQ